MLLDLYLMLCKELKGIREALEWLREFADEYDVEKVKSFIEDVAYEEDICPKCFQDLEMDDYEMLYCPECGEEV